MATALVLGRAGHTVHATMRNPRGAPELEQTAAREKLPITVSAMDVDSDESVTKAIGAIEKAHGPLDVLVDNAGIERRGSTEELALSQMRAVMETNSFGAVRCIQAVVPQMRERRTGCIIHVSSVAGRIADPAPASPYPHTRRWAGIFTATLRNPASPVPVGQKILEIVESGTWQLRHPVGPDAAPFLQWRGSVNDEQWVDWASVDDDTFYGNIERDFGRNARPPQ